MIKNRYILASFLKTFLIASAGFLALFFLIQVLTDLPDALKAHKTLDPGTYWLLLPMLFVQISPIITFLSSLFLIAEMLKYNEIRVLEISGVRPFQVYRVLFFGAGLVTLAVFLVNSRLVPACLKAAASAVVPEEVSFSSSGLLLYSREFVAPGYLKEPWISYMRPDKKLLTVQGKAAYYQNGYWNVCQGKYWLFREDGLMEEEAVFSRLALYLPLEPDVLAELARPAEQLSFRELKTLLARLEKLGLVPVSLRVSLQEKVAYPFLNVFIILASIPFFLWREKLNRFLVISLSVLFSFFCYLFYSTSLALARGGKLPVFLAVWLVHLFIFLVSAGLLLKLQTGKKSYII